MTSHWSKFNLPNNRLKKKWFFQVETSNWFCYNAHFAYIFQSAKQGGGHVCKTHKRNVQWKLGTEQANK